MRFIIGTPERRASGADVWRRGTRHFPRGAPISKDSRTVWPHRASRPEAPPNPRIQQRGRSIGLPTVGLGIPPLQPIQRVLRGSIQFPAPPVRYLPSPSNY